MKGFVLLAYNNSERNKIAHNDLENDLKRRSLRFDKKELNSISYDTIFSYQILKENEQVINNTLSTLIAGDIYGIFTDDNQRLLNYQEALKLIEKYNIVNEYTAFEGNACVCKTFENKIVFQTDLEGYRKIYYYQEDGILCVSTYLPLILKAIRKNWKLRKNAVISFICSRESKWPLTFVDEIFSLSPLSRAEVTKNGLHITSKTFSELYKLEKITKKKLQEQLYEQYKLITQRKVGENIAVTLSGGYDSNCLTKLYSNTFKDNFTAISVGFEAKRERDNNIYNETIYAEKIAQAYGIPFKRYFFSKNDFLNEFTGFIDSIDQPGLDPSSNYIMNKNLYEDGFDLVVNGMGGDASYKSITNHRDLYFGLWMFKHLNVYALNNIGKIINYRGPFRFFKPIFKNEKPNSFHDLIERIQIFSSPVCQFINEKYLSEIDEEREKRIGYFEKIYSNANTLQEISYSLALFSSPDEYHALSMAEINNMEILMPFVNIKTAIMLMNGSRFHNVNNRNFELSVFEGINTELLAKSKSGLSIPYSEWMSFIAEGVFEFYNDLNYFKDSFDIQIFRDFYKKEETFAKSIYANMVIYKLLVVMEYIKAHNLYII